MNRNMFNQNRKISSKLQGSKLIGEVQTAFQKLKIDVATSDLARKEMGSSTIDAIRTFQKRVGLPVDGKLSEQTVHRLNRELEHQYVARNKTRTQRLHEMLQRTGHELDPEEIQHRQFGSSTQQALKQFQAKTGMTPDGLISEKAVELLRHEVLKERMKSKTQIAEFHKTLLRALYIGKLNHVRVDHQELKERKIGTSTKKAIQALQQKYGLPVTGELDPETYDRLISLASSLPRPRKRIKAKKADELKLIRKTVRLNKQGQLANDVQNVLAYLGYSIDEQEYKKQVFGKTTREAVVQYQRANHLPVTGHVEGMTLQHLNNEVRQVNPEVGKREHVYRIRGSVRDELWKGIHGVKVQIWEHQLSGPGALLAERRTMANGFFDIPYDPPRDETTKQVKSTFSLRITAMTSDQQEMGSKVVTQPGSIAWANFTKGPYPYRGDSEFAKQMTAVQKVIGKRWIQTLVETEEHRQISETAQLAHLATEDVMRLVLSHLMSAKLQHSSLGPAACYAFIGQNLPPSLPSDLIDSTDHWEGIDQLIEVAINGLIFMEDELQASALEQAISLNLIPIAVILQKEEILQSLATLKRTYALEKPILIGEGSLKDLLDTSPLMKPYSDAVVEAFLTHKNLDEAFQDDLTQNADRFGGMAAVQEFTNVIYCGQITTHYTPMMTVLRRKMTDASEPYIHSARDLAKLTVEQWEQLIDENGGQVPPNIQGKDSKERVRHYSETLVQQSERLFPEVALVSSVKRSAKRPLTQIEEIEGLIDKHLKLDMRMMNMDVFFKEQGIEDRKLLSEVRVLQRVHRLTPSAIAAQALLDQKIHSSAQIITMGKQRFVEQLTSHHPVDQRTALTIYGLAEYQYAQVLKRMTEFRFEWYKTDPKAINHGTESPDRIAETWLSTPDLETLFGSLDYCDCPDCLSVFGPPAYMTDLLRFLDSHPSEQAGKTVKDILFERRPDIGHIKLNCENTDTPLPYIDLVCEVLEHAIPAPSPHSDFNLQTTRAASELRAFPEHVRPEAYATLKIADYPLDVSFDLWQEEARLYLQHLGFQRWEIMTSFQSKTNEPSSISIAGEYWGISSHETKIITTQENTANRQSLYWGFDANAEKVTVADFMLHSGLDYGQLIDLLRVQWVHPTTDPHPMVIERPNATCHLEEQKLVYLNVDRLDRMHRFLRLWRHTDWSMWELDLLIRHPSLGNHRIDDNTLIRLQQFQQIQQRLGLSLEETLVLFGDLNTENRDPSGNLKNNSHSLYTSMFLKPTAGYTTDPKFILPLDEGERLSESKGTLMAAYAVSEADLNLLLKRIDSDDLSMANLSLICRLVHLARGLGLEIKDLLIFEALAGRRDRWNDPASVLAWIQQLDWVRRSDFSLDELDYILSYKPDSPHGLRDEVITQYIQALAEALRSQTVEQSEGTIIAQLASSFALPSEQVKIVLASLTMEGKPFVSLLNDPALTEQDEDGEYQAIQPDPFKLLYKVYRYMHRVSLLLKKWRLETADLEWLLEYATDFQLLALGSLPKAYSSTDQLFASWLNLSKWLYFKKLYPEPANVSLREIFHKASQSTTSVAEILADLVRLTQWDQSDLEVVVAELGLRHGEPHVGSSDYTQIETYLRLSDCFKQLKRIGVGASQVLTWVNRDQDLNGEQVAVARQIKQIVKSKYDDDVWLEKAVALEDILRERKRKALVSYLVEHSMRTTDPILSSGDKTYANPAYWRDANDLFHYYLIDVEMSACQLTSRIKQAISSVQMFVQRCLLGLEQPVIEVSRAQQQETVSDNSWSQWKWMKNYRVWEANRKIFLYPENWIEPELRDHKTPFFKELEEEIMQKEITDEHVQSAFLNYIQKVHEVSRLEITGVYYELDDTDPRDDLAPDIHRLHVVGRTRTHPSIYYYRQLDLNYGEWTPWEKIDLDIQSEQVAPVVYNRQLYLFWLHFIEKPQKVKKQPPAQASNDTNLPETPNQLEIQLAWSTHKSGGWTPKKISKQKLIHPWHRPLFAYNLKPRYKHRENLLWMDLYITQTQEFNNKRFWDAYRNKQDFVTANRYDETSRPWHSSSFVFDGEVVDVKMKPLTGRYRVLDRHGMETEHLTQTNSYQYVRDNFSEDGRTINPLSRRTEVAPRLPLPDGMHYYHNRLVNNKRNLNASRVNILENGRTQTLLRGGKSPFELISSQHQVAFDTGIEEQMPFFYQDPYRTFFIKPEWQQLMMGHNWTLHRKSYHLFPFYHPYTAMFLHELKRSGVEGLLNRNVQMNPHQYGPGNDYHVSGYMPVDSVTKPDPSAVRDTVDFEFYGAYSIYNWEIFFHAPLLIACKLSANQRFEEAMRWFHFIFDPTHIDSSDVPQRYWVTYPFFKQNSDQYRKQRIEQLLNNIEEHSDQLKAWKNHPFKPHLIARHRPVAYQKVVVMKYIDNLIAWGDQLFRQDTIETLNEATTLYVLAYELLGRKPVRVHKTKHVDLSFNELTEEENLDSFGNRRVEILMENFTGTPVSVTRTQEGSEPLPQLDVFYFGIPNNDRLMEYWDTVEDRLFKIRNCMNIDGVVRQLPLFEPPIDPALLVQAAAAGVDLSSVLSESAVVAGPYRFERLVAKAVELCQEVKALGDKLLSVLEKYDAEQLALLRSSQEIKLNQAIREVRKQQIKEAMESLASLEKSKELAQEKRDFYMSREFINAWEGVGLTLGGVSAAAQTAISIGYVLAGGLRFIPKIAVGFSGFGGSPHGTTEIVDGEKLGQQAEAAVKTLSAIAGAADKFSALAFTMGGYERRMEDWEHQGKLAKIEIEQLDKQIEASKIRLAIAEKELENQDLQMEQAQAVDEVMRSKYTNAQLYDYQIRQVSSIYFQSYQLVYDLAKRAEKSFQFEVSDPAATFVQFGYWDSLKKGLLSGDRLLNDLRRMESAYLDLNKRDLEITKHISLAQIQPLSLIALKESGSCTVVLPEWLYDMDYPGHYKRRIKSVSISIPAVVGPYTSVNCTLSLTHHGIRVDDRLGEEYGNPLLADDTRFYKSPTPVMAIATSHGQNDAGMFELNFRDDRYLPFEGAGAVSEWRIEMPHENNPFDLSTISDVIMHIHYTARASSHQQFIRSARENVDAVLPKVGKRLFVLNHEFGTAWQRFMHVNETDEQTLAFTLERNHLPFYARSKSNIILTKLDLIVDGEETVSFDVKLSVPGATTSDEIMTPHPEFGGRQHMAKSSFGGSVPLLGEWELQIKKAATTDFKSLTSTDIRNAYLIVEFSMS